ncbi:PTS sugar transporter subunit IIA [Lactiplantibacillus xiangfangensis]|nr:hypothetical protein [Lactiplantibacillus xiangfangensis]
MKRQIIIASHVGLARGMKETLQFLSGQAQDVDVLCAYTDNEPLIPTVDKLMNQYRDTDQVIVFTDLLPGSVNQAFYKYREWANVKIITGMNLPLILGVALAAPGQILDDPQLQKLITEAQQQIILMNEYVPVVDEEDE